MSILRIFIYLLHALCVKNQLQLITSNNILFNTDNYSNLNDCYCLTNIKTSTCNYSSSSVRNVNDEIKSTTELSTFQYGNDEISMNYNKNNTNIIMDDNLPTIIMKLNKSKSIDISDKEILMNEAFMNFSMNYSMIMFKHHENVVISPISIAILMFLTSYGACYCTKETINIGYNLPNEIQSDVKLIKSFINNHSNIRTNEISIDHKIFIPDNIKLSDKFMMISKQIFKLDLQQINFTNNEETARIINNWSANKTNNNIRDVVNSSQFSNETNLVLMSVALFNCELLKPFNFNRTRKMDFIVNGTYKKVWTMNQVIECRYGTLKQFHNSTFIQLFFNIKNLSTKHPMTMTIIRPNELINISNIVSKLYQLKLDDLNDYNDIVVNISLPKFKIDSKINLNDYKSEMGIDIIFSDEANFNRITKSRHLKVTDIIQSSIIVVNEGYNESLGDSTNVEVNDKITSKIQADFNVNRPFIVLIANNGGIIASAQIIDPY